MNRAESFLQAIRAEPDDDLARLVFADWLIDHGDPRGEFIHAQVRLAALPHGDPARMELAEHAADLLREHEAAWVGPVRSIVQNWQFRRGFLEQVTLTEQAFLQHADDLTHAFPLRSIRLMVEGAGRFGELAACPHLADIEEIECHSAHTSYGPPALDDRSFAVFIESPYLDSLKSLRITGNALAYPHLQALLAAPLCSRLVRLDLSGNVSLGGQTGRMLAEAATATRLEELTLSETRLGIYGLLNLLVNGSLPQLRRLEVAHADLTESAAGSLGKAFASSAVLPRLTHLDLNGWGQDPIRNWAELFRSNQISQLRILRLHGHKLGDVNVRALAESPHLKYLTGLDLAGNLLTHEAGQALAEAPHLAHLTELNLARNNLRDRGTRALADSPHLRHLGTLDLSHNSIGGPGLRALASSPSLSHLTTLRLGTNFIGMEILAALAALPHLTQLDLSSNHMGPEAACHLADSPHLSRLTHLDLSGNALGDAGLRALAVSPWLTRLVELKLGGNQIGEEGSAAMLALFAESAVLGGLRRLGLKGNAFSENERVHLASILGQRLDLR